MKKYSLNIFLTPFDLLESSISSIINRICVNERYDEKKIQIYKIRLKLFIMD